MIVCTSLIATKQNKDDGSRTGMAVSRIRDEQNERTDEKESIRNERMKKTSKELRLISVKKIDFCEYLNWRAICTHDFGLQICKPKSCTYWLSQEMKAVSGQVFMATPPKKIMQHMHDNIPNWFDFWADLVVHLLLLKSFMAMP